MQVLEVEEKRATVILTIKELLVIQRSLIEVHKRVEVFEFQTLMALSREESDKLLSNINHLIDEMKSKSRS